MNDLNVWFSNNLWVLLGLLIPFVWTFVKAKFPIVSRFISIVLQRNKKSPEQTEEDVLLELLKKLSQVKGVPGPVNDPVDTKSEVVQSLAERLKQLLADKTKQIEEKLAGLKKVG